MASGDTVVVNGYTTAITLADNPTGKTITATANRGGLVRVMRANVTLGTGIAFHYGIQSGQGGFLLQNSSSVTGDVFSGGSVSASGNEISGDVISAGSAGLIDNVHVDGSAYAHTIANSTVDGDAYYVIKTGTSVGGTSYPNSLDQGPAALPISDSQIAQWESDAVAGGTVTCSNGKYTINANTTIGPEKIPCDLSIINSTTVTIAGPIWVTGNITTQNSSIVKMSPTLGNQNVAIIADDPSDRINSSIITTKDSSSFQNNGGSGSFVFLISQNNSAENGGNVNAISINNSGTALIAYAGHGQISIGQSVHLKEATAYKIILTNSANVTYDTGLANTLFTAGPGGGWSISSWTETQ